MILEVAVLHIIESKTDQFEINFKKASEIISKRKGYIKHELHKNLSNKNKYILMVQWETLEDHTIGFRGSEEYKDWKSLLHHFYEPFPEVEYYKQIY
jgi:heme-degrading monooxygenase HmoA